MIIVAVDGDMLELLGSTAALAAFLLEFSQAIRAVGELGEGSLREGDLACGIVGEAALIADVEVVASDFRALVVEEA